MYFGHYYSLNNISKKAEVEVGTWQGRTELEQLTLAVFRTAGSGVLAWEELGCWSNGCSCRHCCGGEREISLSSIR